MKLVFACFYILKFNLHREQEEAYIDFIVSNGFYIFVVYTYKLPTITFWSTNIKRNENEIRVPYT